MTNATTTPMKTADMTIGTYVTLAPGSTAVWQIEGSNLNDAGETDFFVVLRAVQMDGYNFKRLADQNHRPEMYPSLRDVTLYLSEIQPERNVTIISPVEGGA